MEIKNLFSLPEDLVLIPENLVSANILSDILEVDYEFIVTLCKEGILKAKYFDKDWNICINQEIPCLSQFKHMLNDENYDILDWKYEMLDFDELDYWHYLLLNDNHNVQFQFIYVEKGIFKNSNGDIYTKYLVTLETYLEVTTWNNSLEKILYDVNQALPNDHAILAVFDNELDAYVYASKIYPRICLEDKIKLKYFELYN